MAPKRSNGKLQGFAKAVKDGRNGYSPSYGLPELRTAIAKDEISKGWNCQSDDIYVCHGVTEALQIIIPSLFVDLRLNRLEAAILPENIP